MDKANSSIMSFGKGILNAIGWGGGANNAIGWGSIYKKSNSGETELTNQQKKNKEDDKK
jgi:hypothetical protein